MMNSLKLKGIQLSRFLAAMASPLVGFGASSLELQIVIKKASGHPNF